MMMDEATRATLQLILGKVQRAHALLLENPPPPDMPVQVELLLQETLADLHHLVGVRMWPVPTSERPVLETLEEWMWDVASCEATDGCVVEPDGICPHSHPSWLLRLGLI